MAKDDGRGRGRRFAKDVAVRRLAAEEYLRKHFPGSAVIFDRLNTGDIAAADIADSIAEMTMEARKRLAPELDGEADSSTTNPEASAARALQAIGTLSAEIEQCHANLAFATSLKAALQDQLMLLRNAQKDQQRTLIQAAAQRPSVDRAVTNLARDLLAVGVTRSNAAKLTLNAQRAWHKPHNWTHLPEVTGAIRFVELPRLNDSVAGELLPPMDMFPRYLLDLEAFKRKAEDKEGNALARLCVSELETWITACYPRPLPRSADVIARAWLPLVGLSGRGVQKSDLWANSLLPSAWTAGKVMRAERVQS